MPQEKEGDKIGQTIEINLSNLKDFFLNCKASLIFGLFGVILISFGAFMLFQKPAKDNSIKIIQDEDKKAKIFVDVQGAVISPGVYELKDNVRVKDALIAAGGLSQEANRSWVAKNLNLAAKISDGAKIFIPQKDELVPSSSALGVSASDSNSYAIQTSQGKININTASLSQLDTLSGIGPVTAQKIIDNRPYNSIDDLVAKKAVWKSTFEKIKDKITTF